MELVSWRGQSIVHRDDDTFDKISSLVCGTVLVVTDLFNCGKVVKRLVKLSPPGEGRGHQNKREQVCELASIVSCMVSSRFGVNDLVWHGIETPQDPRLLSPKVVLVRMFLCKRGRLGTPTGLRRSRSNEFFCCVEVELERDPFRYPHQDGGETAAVSAWMGTGMC